MLIRHTYVLPLRLAHVRILLLPQRVNAIQTPLCAALGPSNRSAADLHEYRMRMPRWKHSQCNPRAPINRQRNRDVLKLAVGGQVSHGGPLAANPRPSPHHSAHSRRRRLEPAPSPGSAGSRKASPRFCGRRSDRVKMGGRADRARSPARSHSMKFRSSIFLEQPISASEFYR